MPERTVAEPTPDAVGRLTRTQQPVCAARREHATRPDVVIGLGAQAGTRTAGQTDTITARASYVFVPAGERR